MKGHTEILKYVEIANAIIIDNQNGRWARGTGNVQIQPVGEGLPEITMFYANGPLWQITQDPELGRTVSLANFVTEIKKKDDPGGTMAGTPAILAETFGDGRFVLFSAHPEFHWGLGNPPLIVDAARWVTKGKYNEAEEEITYRAVFSNVVKGVESTLK